MLEGYSSSNGEYRLEVHESDDDVDYEEGDDCGDQTTVTTLVEDRIND